MTLIIGKDVRQFAQTLIEHGSDEVILVENEKLEEYLVLPFLSVFEQVMKVENPEIALFAATTSGRELAPRIWMKTDSGVSADCTGLEIVGEYTDIVPELIERVKAGFKFGIEAKRIS